MTNTNEPYKAGPAAGIAPVSALTGPTMNRDEMDGFARVMHGFRHAESRESERFGLTGSGFEENDQKIISRIVAKSSEQSTGFFGRMWNYIVTFFESLMKGFDFGNFQQRVDVRSALPAAVKAHEDLNANGYGNIAERVSGVKRETNGTYTPIVTTDPQGRQSYTGVFSLEMERRNPMQMAKNDAADVGRVPTDAQTVAVEAVYDAKMKEIYSRQEVKDLVMSHRTGNLKTEGRDIAKSYTEEVYQAIINDPQVQSQGQFNYAKQHPNLKEVIEGRIFRDHEQHAKEYLSGDLVAAVGQFNAGHNPQRDDYQGYQPGGAAKNERQVALNPR